MYKKNGQYFDALRPAVEPEGFNSPEDVIAHRKYHIKKVRKLFKRLDLFIFTLGLTEMWIHAESGTVYPTAPGTLAGEFKDDECSFENAQFQNILSDFHEFQKTLLELRGKKTFKILLTVSPVPLTASTSGQHVLLSTNYSKATLRSVAGQLSMDEEHIDYFPSYEIVTNPRLHSTSFAENLRSVRNETVDTVMKHFFNEHPSLAAKQNHRKRTGMPAKKSFEDLQCEEALMEAFAR